MNRRRRKKLTKRLVLAALLGVPTEVESLLRAGADPRTPDPDGTTPLYIASVQGEARIVRALLAAGADPDAESGHGDQGTPLCGAACWGYTEAVRELLAHGADPNLREDKGKGNTPLYWALHGPHEETATVLREGASMSFVKRGVGCGVRRRCRRGVSRTAR
ncbi:ankyrin repeat domain-containing protein [Streptomyces sp. MZ04]|nr:ankyrin repeat domain-containing protein [Streptomyces sp. MZ04]